MTSDRPLFSVVIPLEFHRGQWEQAWLAWLSQTADPSLYEIILVVPHGFAALAELKALAGDRARLEFGACEHDIGLCAFGATKARGTYLFFTESHCRPEPEVLALCARAVAAHPEWAGFSCRSIPICHNRLSVAEAAMYDADIEVGMRQHPWRKVLDQCFVTRRDLYEECDGFRAELGHFAEWVLAAAYFARGYQIGYLEEARFHHYYVGQLDDLKTFTRDFVRGEIRYLAEGDRAPESRLIEAPVEWITWAGFDAGLARAALAALVGYSLAGRGWRRPDEKLRALLRHAIPALFGDRAARLLARLDAVHARLALTVATAAGSDGAIGRWLKRYIAALIRLQRLDCLRDMRRQTGPVAGLIGHQIVAHVGFHAQESAMGHTFRWSEPQAAVRIAGRPGRVLVRIDSPALRAPLNEIRTQFYLDGARLDPDAVQTGRDGYLLSLELPSSGRAVLAWACPLLRGDGDARALGLCIAGIETSQESVKEDWMTQEPTRQESANQASAT